MKKIIGTLAVLTLLVSCDYEVGYLFSENASYPVKEMQILSADSLKGEVVSLTAQLDSYSGILSKYDALKATFDEVEKQYYALSDAASEKYNEWQDYLALPDDQRNSAQETALEAASTAADKAFYTYESDVYEPARKACNAQKDVIDSLSKAGFNPIQLRTQRDLDQRRIKEAIPWSTTLMEQIEGTKPMQYSILRVTSQDGNVENFLPHISILGGGRIQISPEVNAKGSYSVSIRVKNPGQQRDLNDIITFIVK